MTQPAERTSPNVVVLADAAVVDGRDVVGRIVGVTLGAVGMGVGALVRPTGRGRRIPVPPVVDAALGAGALAADVATRAAGTTGRLLRPVVGAVTRPPLVPRSLTLGAVFDLLVARGNELRYDADQDVTAVIDAVLPRVVEGTLSRLDLTDVVVRNVDLDAVVAAVALDAPVTRALDGLDLTAVVLERVDLQRVITAALDRLDLTAVVLERVDLQRVITAALDRLDLTAVVLDRVDLDRVVTAALDHLDLTDVVLDRVELQKVVTQVLDGMDLTALVLDRVDVVALADYIIDAIDLPEIIRESTSGVASETVRGVRMRSIEADAAVSRTFDRLLFRRRARDVDAPGDPESLRTLADDASRDGGGQR